MNSFIKATHFFIALGIFFIPLWGVWKLNINEDAAQLLFVLWLLVGWTTSILYYTEMTKDL